MLKLFSFDRFLEGISYLLLFGIGMPLKYLAQIPEPNIYTLDMHWLSYSWPMVVLGPNWYVVEKKWDLKCFRLSFL